MIRSLLVAAVVGTSLSLGQFATGQTTVATDPVGFNTVTINANTVRALSLPLDDTPAFSGPVSNRTSNTIQTSNAGWTANAFGPFASNPHIIRMLSGASKGKQFRIASNTTDTLTLTMPAGSDLNTQIAANDRYQIFSVATLANLFGPTGEGLNTSTDPSVADNVLLRVGASWITFYNDGTQWLRQGTGTASNNVPILPEQGFLFARKAGAALPFTLTGAVPTTNLQTDLPANRVTAFANRFPVNLTLTGTQGSATALNFHQLNGWNANSNPDLADQVLLRVGASWLTYYYDGANWLRQGAGATPQNPTIVAGTSMLVVRRAGSDITFDQQLPYTL